MNSQEKITKAQLCLENIPSEILGQHNIKALEDTIETETNNIKREALNEKIAELGSNPTPSQLDELLELAENCGSSDSITKLINNIKSWKVSMTGDIEGTEALTNDESIIDNARVNHVNQTIKKLVASYGEQIPVNDDTITVVKKLQTIVSQITTMDTTEQTNEIEDFLNGGSNEYIDIFNELYNDINKTK